MTETKKKNAGNVPPAARPASKNRKTQAESARRLSVDNATVQAARQEVQGLDETDLAGEISMLRVTLKRVFSLAAQVAAELAEADNETQAANQQGKSPKEKSLDKWIQALESLGQGAMRLANLMRAHKALRVSRAEEVAKAFEPTIDKLSGEVLGNENPEEGRQSDGG